MIATDTSTQTALIVAPRAEQGSVSAILAHLGFSIVGVEGAQAVAALREPVSLCLIDLRGNGEAIRIARAVRTRHPKAIVIGVADPERPVAAAEAIRAGVFDVLPRPATARDLGALISNAREQAALAALPAPAAPPAASYGLVGGSPAMRAVMDLVERAAAGRCGVLVSGEQGSGREMIARAIHAHSGNRSTAFVKVDGLAPMPEEIERALFGASRKRVADESERRHLERIGRRSLLHEAAGGVLFLEHITEIPARVQARLARVLRDGEVLVQDSRSPMPFDCRPIAAVDGAFDAAIEEGRVRPDLHARLSLLRIDVPALRQRREDIPFLAAHFLKELCQESGKPIKTLSPPALTLLAALPWRGNTPELKAMLERLMILLVPHGLIRLEDVLAHTRLDGAPVTSQDLKGTLKQARARFERDYIAAMLHAQGGRIPDAARELGIQRTNLYRKMRRLNLVRPFRGA